jgi:hypothetical protein
MVGRLHQDEFRVNTDERCGKLEVERFTQTKVEGGLSAKTVRNPLFGLAGYPSPKLHNSLHALHAKCYLLRIAARKVYKGGASVPGESDQIKSIRSEK